MDPMEAIRAGRSGWRSDLEDAIRAGSPGPTRQILAAHSAAEALLYIEARGLLAKVVKEAGGSAGAVDVIQQLLALGAAVDLLSSDPIYREALLYSGNNGSTPMNWAACLGYVAIIEALLTAGAETEKKNAQGCTPLFMAAANGHRPCCTVLLRAGADAEAMTTDGRRMTPITVAEQAGHLVIAEQLREALAAQELPPEQQAWIAQALRLKDQGNAALKAGNMRRACEAYRAGLQQLEGGAAVGHRRVPGAEAQGLRVILLSNRAEALLKTTGHDSVVHYAAGNDCVEALKLDPGHVKSQRRLQRADNVAARVEKADAIYRKHMKVVTATEQELTKALNEGRRLEDGVEEMLRRGTTAARKCTASQVACRIGNSLNSRQQEAQLFQITRQFEPAEALARATLAEAAQLTQAADWPSPICHPDVDGSHNGEYQRQVLQAMSGAQFTIATCLMKQQRRLDEALALFLAGIAGWTPLAVKDSRLLKDIFIGQTTVLELQCQMGDFQAAVETAEVLRGKLARGGQGTGELTIEWLLDMGIHHALTATQMLDLATGKDGAVDAGTHTTARALYEQMLEVLGGLVGAEREQATEERLEAKVHRRFWMHAGMTTSVTGDCALRGEQQRAMVAALRAVGRWEEHCAICLEVLDPADGHLEVVECLHSFHQKCMQDLAQKGKSEVEDSRPGAPVGADLSFHIECPLCRMPLEMFGRTTEPEPEPQA